MYITTCRGLGAGPNGGEGFVSPPQGHYIGDIQLGTFQKVKVPGAAQLSAYTTQVIDDTFRSIHNYRRWFESITGFAWSPEIANQIRGLYYQGKPDL